MGINTGDLDSHICSKVISTLVSDFFTEFPQITPLCIMCVWSMGEVKEKYFKYESYGYQYVGHFASSKDKNIFFACSPHSFDFSYIETLQADHVKRWVKGFKDK